MKNIALGLTILAIVIGFVVPTLAATTPIGGPMGGDNFSGQPGINLNATTIFRIITGFACWATRIALLLIVAALVFYALQFVYSRGNPAGMQSAERALWLGIIGIVVILGAYTIVATIGYTITGDEMKFSNYLPLRCN